MFRRILVPLDGSEASEAILSQVRRLLRREDAEVILLRAVDVPVGFEIPPNEDRWIDGAMSYVRELERKLEGDGVRIRSIVEVGRPAEVILDVAAREKASLIAMSLHGRSGLTRWVFGSVTEKVLRSRCPAPLLLVRSFRTSAELAVRKILVPIDGSPASRAAVAPAASLARLFGSEIVVLHVEEAEPEYPIAPGSRNRLEDAVNGFAFEGIEAAGLLRGGDAATEILKACDQQGIDLVAMTTHGRSGLSRWVLGSVTEKVLRAATVPMLVVPDAPVPAGVPR